MKNLDASDEEEEQTIVEEIPEDQPKVINYFLTIRNLILIQIPC